ncbi:MAG: PGAP1 family protein [Parcubacteria group bacterium Gr01-1014_70]|nr:MAG: PGAP1 family protein [Parcubacteria group bacterium Gr01-1014_70]
MVLTGMELTKELMRFWANLAHLLTSEVYVGKGILRGHGEPVLLVPGFLAGDWSLYILNGWLKHIGYKPYMSDIVCNVYCPDVTMRTLRRRVEKIILKEGTISVIGHSLGGLLARAIGHEYPENITHVITLGTPLRNLTTTSSRFSDFVKTLAVSVIPCLRIAEENSITCACNLMRVMMSPLPKAGVATSVFSKEDAIVDWFMSWRPDEKFEEVTGGHAGLVVNPEVYRVLARILAAS